MFRSLLPLLLGLSFFLTPLHSASDLPWEKLPDHPRLFARTTDWTALRARIVNDPVSTRLFSSLRADADTLLTTPPVPLIKEGRRLLGPVRIAQLRIVLLAMVARLTDDDRYALRAIEEMRHLAAAPDWNPSHFLDTAEAALALGTGYDWLHDRLSPADRTLIENAIIEKGLRPSFDTPNGKPLGWIRGTNNWNQVCHGGLAVAALAIAERDPELARQTVQRAIDNLKYSAHAYAPDGAYPEGPMYWGYGTTFHVLLIEALRTALGTTAGLDAFPGFLASADYIQQVTTPAGRFYAYSDATDKRGFNPALFWFAKRLGRADLVRTDLAWVKGSAGSAPRKISGDRFIPFALLWHDPSLKYSDLAAPLHWYARGDNPIGIHRSAWNTPHAVYLAVKGGSPSLNHAHMDAGSFLIEADGVIWAVDTGMQDYHSLESKGIRLWATSQDAQRWQVFRLGPEGHNILRFNNGAQNWKASAIAGRFRADGEAPFTQFDLTPLYAGQVTAVRRGVSLRADHRIVIQDEWTALPEKPADVTWQWLTFADVTITGNTLTLSQKGERLHLAVRSAPDLRIEVEDVSAPRQPYDVANPGLKRIRIHTSTASGGQGSIHLLITPGSIEADLPVPELRSLADW